MAGVLAGSNRRSYRRCRGSLIAAVAVLGLAVALAAGPAVAKKITGTKRSELIVGTKGTDRIKGKGGNDLIKGKGGRDRLNGGKGSNRVVGGKGNDKVIGGPLGDTLVGGPGVDSHRGGSGNDLLDAKDGRRDSVIDAGTGTNKCIIDTVELSIVRGCGTVQATRPDVPGGGPGGPGGGGGGGGGGGTGQGLQLISYECTIHLPGVCIVFNMTGDGADQATVLSPVQGGGGLTNVVGFANAPSPPAWSANGGFNCTGAGFLTVTIGSQSLDVPVPCPTS
jgi:Ca2+-binding RTX toxin-like protein